MLRWACERSGQPRRSLLTRFPNLDRWQRGESSPTLKQLEALADATHVPVGYLFLGEPPIEQVPIPDFRTMGTHAVRRPSPDLLDTVYLCEQRQEWFRDFARSMGEAPLGFVGSAKPSDKVETAAQRIRHALAFDLEERVRTPTWTDALRLFIGKADDLGVLVMVNGVVGNNNRRRLDPEEFRGFALSDGLAPLVFINGADTKAAQMFTLAHELAHVWLGATALSEAEAAAVPEHRVERWCNLVAAELLVPLAALRAVYDEDEPLRDSLDGLARRFKVSTLVVLRRIHDAGGLTQDELWAAYRQELLRLRALPRRSGGDFYRTQSARVGRRFARALVASTLEGQTLHRDAFRLLGFSKLKTFQDLGRSLGVG